MYLLCYIERISTPKHCKLTYTFQDMAAHSAYDFRGGRAEHLALAKYRKVIYMAREGIKLTAN